MNLFRLLELIFTLILLLLVSPLFCLIALIIKSTSQGPIFFYSQRIGLHGKAFFCFKFRTMRSTESGFLKEYFAKHPKKKLEWELYHKLTSDPRVYPFGNFLRKTSLDELPQLLNVLNGSMSLCGPRPLLDEDLVKIPLDLKTKFLSIKPGITGLWQISGRNTMSFLKRVELESNYIDKKNVFLDIKIFFKTIPVVLLKKGAF
jgi:undecaprenyl-phosphate galactose phosphotransferase